MSQITDTTITIRAPKFEPMETVVLNFNGIRITQIDKRWYELDRDAWWYQCLGDDVVPYPESAFTKFDYESYRKELQKNH